MNFYKLTNQAQFCHINHIVAISVIAAPCLKVKDLYTQDETFRFRSLRRWRLPSLHTMPQPELGMSIICVEAGELLAKSAPYSSRIESMPGSLGTNVYRDGVILVEPSQPRRDRLAAIIGSEWKTSVIALASVEEWLKLCDYVPAGLILLSQLAADADDNRTHNIARLQARKPGTPVFMISTRHADHSSRDDDAWQFEFRFGNSLTIENITKT